MTWVNWWIFWTESRTGSQSRDLEDKPTEIYFGSSNTIWDDGVQIGINSLGSKSETRSSEPICRYHQDRISAQLLTNLFSRFQSASTDVHWTHLKRILRYLKGSINNGLIKKQREGTKSLFGYADVDWGNNLEDRRSISDIMCQVYGATDSWMTWKQNTVAFVEFLEIQWNSDLLHALPWFIVNYVRFEAVNMQQFTEWPVFYAVHYGPGFKCESPSPICSERAVVRWRWRQSCIH